MKKITRMFVSAATIISVALIPSAVYAQSNGVIDVGGGTTTPTTTTPTTDAGKGAGVPDTGIAPKNQLVQNSAVFVGGGLLGAGIGLGIITLRKKRL